MVALRTGLRRAAIGILMIELSGCHSTDLQSGTKTVSTETASRTIEDGGTGPYPALMASDSTLTTHTIFHPKDLTVFGRKQKLPIIAWGNGACANSPWEHVNFLSEVASHGFLVVAIGPMPAEGQRGGAGGTTKSSLLSDAINWAIAQNSDKSSQYYRQAGHHENCCCRHVLRRFADSGGRSRSASHNGDDL